MKIYKIVDALVAGDSGHGGGQGALGRAWPDLLVQTGPNGFMISLR